MKKVTRHNYRQYYKEYYGIEFGKEYSVHHIDMNRDNNDISNLLLLPRFIHNKLHLMYNSYKNSHNKFTDISSLFDSNFSDHDVVCAKMYLETVYLARKWYIYKSMNYININL